MENNYEGVENPDVNIIQIAQEAENFDAVVSLLSSWGLESLIADFASKTKKSAIN